MSITTGAKIIVGLSRPKFLNDSALAGDGRGRDLPSSAARNGESDTAKANQHHRPGRRLRNRPGGGGEHAARMRVVELFRVVDSDTVVKQQIKKL